MPGACHRQQSKYGKQYFAWQQALHASGLKQDSKNLARGKARKHAGVRCSHCQLSQLHSYQFFRDFGLKKIGSVTVFMLPLLSPMYMCR